MFQKCDGGNDLLSLAYFLGPVRISGRVVIARERICNGAFGFGEAGRIFHVGLDAGSKRVAQVKGEKRRDRTRSRRQNSAALRG